MNQPAPVVVPYPRESETDVVLRDGSTVHVRPVRSSDERAIRAFLDGVSREAIGFRFFGAPDLNWVVSWSLDVDYVDRFALVAETGEPRRIISHAAYERGGRARAEVAFLVADAWQRGGAPDLTLAGGGRPLSRARTDSRDRGRQVKVVAWYDNEWGYSSRLVDLAERVLVPVAQAT